MGKRILVLGGGIGGQVVANEVRRRLSADHRVTLVERDTRHAFAPSFLWVMTGDRRPEQIVREVRELLRPGVELVQGEVHGIDVAGARVDVGRESLPYDYLVVALGAELAPEAVPGLVSAHTFYTLGGSSRLRAALDGVREGTVALVIGGLPYKCPGAPHEGAMLLGDFFRRHGRDRGVEIHLVTPEPQPMPVAGPVLGDAVRQMLEDRNVRFHASHRLVAVDADTRELRFDGQEPMRYDLLVAIPPHRAPAVVREAGLVNEGGWIPVDRRTLATRHERVYAIGDVTTLPIPGRWKPDVPMMLPKAGVFAHGQALVVADEIASEVDGRAPTAGFCGDGFCMLEAGDQLAGVAFGDFFGEPTPTVEVRPVGKAWHLGKVLFERWWLAPWGLRRATLRSALALGSRLYGLPVNL